MNKPMMSIGVALLALSSWGDPDVAVASKDALASLDRLTFVASRGQVVSYKGRQALELMPLEGDEHKDAELLAIVQYVGHPDFGWKKLHEESPGVYESYADLEPGVWTHLRVEVAGAEARCYVNGAAQPALIVHDLKLGDVHGPIALWSHTTTVGYFSKLKVK
jgi:hypothetical protein